MSRTTTGWIPDKVDIQQETTLSELDDLEGLSPEQLQAAIAYSPDVATPLATQNAANSERQAWGTQWAVDSAHDVLVWPETLDPLPPMSLKRFKDTLASFAAGTGLGWDGVHPRALLRLPDDVLLQWMALLLKCERFGIWPRQVGIVVVVLLPKTDGGFRPIGLLPFLPRVWMRARRDDAKLWEVRCDRPFLYAGSGRGSTVAAWKQAARAEVAAASGEHYAQVLLDLVKAFERIPYRILLREADRLGYPLRLLKLAIATYKLPRVIRVGNAVSDLVWAVRGIVAGSGLAWVALVVRNHGLLQDWDCLPTGGALRTNGKGPLGVALCAATFSLYFDCRVGSQVTPWSAAGSASRLQ